jgi:hypothetical protein
VIVALLARDLIIASKISEAASQAGAEFHRFDDPEQLPPASDIDLLLVDWGDRQPDWGVSLVVWMWSTHADPRPRIILFGPHVDLEAHAAARGAGLGPMRARSKLLADLPSLLAN